MYHCNLWYVIINCELLSRWFFQAFKNLIEKVMRWKSHGRWKSMESTSRFLTPLVFCNSIIVLWPNAFHLTDIICAIFSYRREELLEFFKLLICCTDSPSYSIQTNVLIWSAIVVVVDLAVVVVVDLIWSAAVVVDLICCSCCWFGVVNVADTICCTVADRIFFCYCRNAGSAAACCRIWLSTWDIAAQVMATTGDVADPTWDDADDLLLNKVMLLRSASTNIYQSSSLEVKKSEVYL